MQIDIIVVGFVLSSCQSVIIHCQEPRCTQFEYDERIFSKVWLVGAKVEQIEDHMTKFEDDLKTRYDKLEKKLHETSNEYLRKCRDLIDAATKNVVKIPQVEAEGWKLIFRGTAGNGDNVYDAWSKGKSVIATKPTSMKRSNSKHYADLNFMNDWNTQIISEIKVALFHSEMEVASLVFDAKGSSRDTWFQQQRLITSSWSSLTKDIPIIEFSLTSHVSRKFNIMKNHGGCEKDAGYFVVNDVYSGKSCDWQLGQTTYPQFMFSTVDGATIWDKRMYDMADYLAIYAKLT